MTWPRIPPFSVHDMRESASNDPPWADYIGIDPAEHAPLPLILQTSGGTTGLPRPMIFTPRDREVMNIITGRGSICRACVRSISCRSPCPWA